MITTNPSFLYGTAWKEDLTETCVVSALSIGFRAIDTANQRKHYYEEGVGLALDRAYSELGIQRSDLFLQTKFTFAAGQDQRKPYDEKAAYRVQVQQSFQSSLEHLRTDYLDSYVLHGPSGSSGLRDADWETWEAMEDLHRNGGVKNLGVSNVSYEQLARIYEGAKVKPKFVQNRCFAETRWDQEIRGFCATREITYQGFSLLTANWRFLSGNVLRPEGRNIPHLVFEEDPELHPEIATIAKQTGKTIQQIVFRFAQQIGMLPITGTRSPLHMKADLEIQDFTLTESQVETIENLAFLT